jgi:hypothetical protein
MRVLIKISLLIILLPLALFAQQLFPSSSRVLLNADILTGIGNSNAAITLTQVPTKFYTNKDSSSSGNITIAWEQSGILGDLYLSRYPNVASGQFPRRMLADNTAGDSEITFNVGYDSVTTGIYYCIIVDRGNSDSTSVEFNMVIEHDQSPGNFSPDGDTTAVRNLSWAPSHPNTPFYHVIVSNRKVRLENVDEDPEKEVTGINIVYQAITNETEILYRATDPSGFFDNTQSPRLASGNKYYWLVFNNYGNNPALTSELVTFAEVPSFYFYNAATHMAAPENTFPVETMVTNFDTLTFQWTPVGNSNYHFYLYEETEEGGNVGSFLIFDTTIVTGDTSLTMWRARDMLVNSNYYWNVAAEEGNRYSASAVDSFAYQNSNSSLLQIKVRSAAAGTPALGRVNLAVNNLATSPTQVVYLTDDQGVFSRELAAGQYRVIARKEGYAVADTIITMQQGTTFNLDLYMTTNPTYFTGRIQIPSATVLPRVRLESPANGDTVTVVGELRSSSPSTSEYTFRANVSPGEWNIYPTAEGFQAVSGDTIVQAISFGQYIEVPVLDLERVPSRIIINVTDEDFNTLNDFTVTFKQNLNVQSFFVTSPPFYFNAAPGQWIVTFSKQGYFSRSVQYEVDVIDGQDTRLDVVMVRSGNLRGRAIDETGAPLSLVAIQATPLDGIGLPASASTGVNGYFGPVLLKPGLYRVTASKAEYSQVDTTITIASLDTVYFNPTLVQLKSFINGTITDENGHPLAGATARYIVGFASGFSPKSDSLGQYTMQVPSDVNLQVFATKTGYASSDTAIVSVPENQTITQDFSLRKLNSIITGKVETFENLQLVPLQGVQITAIDTITLQTVYRDTTDSLGRYKVYTDAGVFQLKAEKQYYLTQTKTRTLGIGDSIAVDFALLKNYGSVAGTVRFSNGDPVSSQIVRSRNVTTGKVSQDTTSADGSYQFNLLEPGQAYEFSTSRLRYTSSPEVYTYSVTGDDTSGFDFTLTLAQITSLEIVADTKKLPSNEVTDFSYRARSGDREVTIEPPLWRIDYADTLIFQTGNFSGDVNGRFLPNNKPLTAPNTIPLDADFAITITDTAQGGGLTVRESGFSISAFLSRADFTGRTIDLRDHTGMVVQLDSSVVPVNENLNVELARLNVPDSKRVTAGTQSYGKSFRLTGLDNLSDDFRLTLPIPPEISETDISQRAQSINLGLWNNSRLEWDVLRNSTLVSLPYYMVSNQAPASGEYTVLITSQPLGIHDLEILPNPFSPNVINRNDPLHRGLAGQVITFNLTSLDIRRPFVTIEIFNMTGERVRDLADNKPMIKGRVAVMWDGRTNSGSWARNGRYIVRIRVKDATGEKEEIKLSVLVK